MALPSVWYHGAVGSWQGWRPDGPARCDHWNSYLGIHFASQLITARRFSSSANLMPRDYFNYADTWHGTPGEVATVSLDLQSPLCLEEEKQLDALAVALAIEAGATSAEVLASQAPPAFSLHWPPTRLQAEMEALQGQFHGGSLTLRSALPARLLLDLSNFKIGPPAEVAARVAARLAGRGHDGVVYGNVIEGSRAIPPFEPTAICFSPQQMHVLSVEAYLPPPIT